MTKDNLFMYKILPFLLPCIRSIQELIWKNLAILVTSPSVILWCSKTNIRHIRYFVKYTWCICADLFYLLSSIYILLSSQIRIDSQRAEMCGGNIDPRLLKSHWRLSLCLIKNLELLKPFSRKAADVVLHWWNALPQSPVREYLTTLGEGRNVCVW